MKNEEIKAKLGQLFVIADPTGERIGRIVQTGQWPDTWVAKEFPSEKEFTVSSVQVIEFWQPPPSEVDFDLTAPSLTDENWDGKLPPNNSLAPGIDTPGFADCPPRSIKVWLALFDHAVCEAIAESRDERGLPGSDALYLEAEWEAAALGRACGMSSRTVGSAMKDLEALGWLRKKKIRGDGGQYEGFSYELLPPPMDYINDMAANDYLDKAKTVIDEKTTRIRRIKTQRRPSQSNRLSIGRSLTFDPS